MVITSDVAGGVTPRTAEGCLAVCNEHGVAMEHAQVKFSYSWALAELGQGEEGIAQIRAALDGQLSTGGEVARPQYISYRAEFYCHTGQTEEGLKAVEDGLATSKRTGDRYYDGELLRLRGGLFKLQGRAGDAECCFQKD